MIKQIGITTDERAVMGGVFRFAETYGLPLDMIFLLMDERNMIPCWVSFYQEAAKAGMKHARILSKLSEPMGDIYGPNFTQHVLGMLDRLKT